jgi:hypothetical protein
MVRIGLISSVRIVEALPISKPTLINRQRQQKVRLKLQQKMGRVGSIMVLEFLGKNMTN